MTNTKFLRYLINNKVCYLISLDHFYEYALKMAAVGNDMNQIAKEVNAAQNLTAEQFERLRADMDRIEEIVSEVAADQPRMKKYIPGKGEIKLY